MTIGIYALFWEAQDLVYIGQSQNIKERQARHISDCKAQNHRNYKVQDAYNLYGEPVHIVLDTCSIETLNELEVYWVKEFDSINTGLNICEPGSHGWGPNSGGAKYTKRQILKVFSLLYRTNLSTKEISCITGVPSPQIDKIVSGYTHTWLRDLYPEKFSILREKVVQKTRINKLRNSYQAIPKYANKVILLKDPKGNILPINTSIAEFCREHALSPQKVSDLLHGNRNTHKGWMLYDIKKLLP